MSSAESAAGISKSKKKKERQKAAAQRRAESTATGDREGAAPVGQQHTKAPPTPPPASSPMNASAPVCTPASASEMLRQKGNRMFKSVATLSPSLHLQRLHEVKQLYTSALQKAAGPAEQAACHKNLAAYHMYYARVEDEEHSRLDEACDAVRSAILALTEAATTGKQCQSDDWLDDIKARRLRAWQYGREICEETGDAAFLLSYNKKLLDLLQKQPSAQKARLAGDVARDLFHAGARCLEVEDHRNAKRFFAAAQGPLTAAEQGLLHVNVKEDPESEDGPTLRDALHRHYCIADSAQETANADKLVKQSLEDSEDLPVGALWQAADMYRSAMVLTRDCDVVGEAKASSRLGMMYYLVLCDKPRAMPLLRGCMQLAHSIAPVPMSADWFRAARDTLQQEQRGVRRRDDEAWQEDKGPILHALKPQLAACKRAADRGFKALVHHIFTEHPSRIIGAKPEIPDCSPDNWKCALQTTLRHYHPDRNHTDPDDTWFVLCEEITKMVNIQYGKMQ